ncbi:uncharacterized protein LOC120846088 [Ixodes scapularis]|uniref:uncharacterized protein LOC120846088 n=1 Tax=Ixodes scapularis TaxID=6945 RepID=UPI001A9FA227|nr:uncharacterized protein LOC120846088 [Ixodes scapularis]
MLVRTFVTLLLVPTLQCENLSSITTAKPNLCMELIKEGGQVACTLSGEGNYDGMSVGNCWISCTKGSNKFLLPHRECDRIFGIESWDGYLKLFGELPPYEYQYCDEENVKRLARWVEEWKRYAKNAKKNLCHKA